MTIFLPIKPQGAGGSSTFALNLKQGLTKKGHNAFLEKPKQYDLLLVSPVCHPKFLLHAKLHKKPIVHRLDGVYYPMTTAGKSYRRHNLPLKIIHQYFADFTIYQIRNTKIENYLTLAKVFLQIKHQAILTPITQFSP